MKNLIAHFCTAAIVSMSVAMELPIESESQLEIKRLQEEVSSYKKLSIDLLKAIPIQVEDHWKLVLQLCQGIFTNTRDEHFIKNHYHSVLDKLKIQYSVPFKEHPEHVKALCFNYLKSQRDTVLFSLQHEPPQSSSVASIYTAIAEALRHIALEEYRPADNFITGVCFDPETLTFTALPIPTVEMTAPKKPVIKQPPPIKFSMTPQAGLRPTKTRSPALTQGATTNPSPESTGSTKAGSKEGGDHKLPLPTFNYMNELHEKLAKRKEGAGTRRDAFLALEKPKIIEDNSLVGVLSVALNLRREAFEPGQKTEKEDEANEHDWEKQETGNEEDWK